LVPVVDRQLAWRLPVFAVAPSIPDAVHSSIAAAAVPVRTSRMRRKWLQNSQKMPLCDRLEILGFDDRSFTFLSSLFDRSSRCLEGSARGAHCCGRGGNGGGYTPHRRFARPALAEALRQRGIVAGLPLGRIDARREDELVVCCTELTSPEAIDRYAAAAAEVVASERSVAMAHA